MAKYKFVQAPKGDKIGRSADGTLQVGAHPIIAFIEGDGTGPDIWRASQHVFDAAVKHCYGGKRKISWMEVFAGEKAQKVTGEFLPEETIAAIEDFNIAIKGPLTTPIGGGFRSLNVAMRQQLNLFACVRPVRHFENVPSPVKRPQDVDMVIFRENIEDVYAGMELQEGRPETQRLISFLGSEYGWEIPADSGIGIKGISETRSKRLIRSALRYALDRGRKSVTLVHKGNIMKFTEGAFMKWGYELVREEFANVAVGWDDCNGDPKGKLLVKDVIADIFLQQTLTRPRDFDVVATMNLNGDYASDALAAQVGGIGIAPGANINYETGLAVFEATHGTAPKYANLDKVNPCSVILSGVMMFEHMGWKEVADTITNALISTFRAKTVTYDFHRLMEGATLLKCSEFGQAVVDKFGK